MCVVYSNVFVGICSILWCSHCQSHKASLADLVCCAASLCVHSLATQSKLSKAIYNPCWPLPIKLMSLQFPRDYKKSRPRPGAWPQFDQESAPGAEEFATKAAEIRQAAILEMYDCETGSAAATFKSEALISILSTCSWALCYLTVTATESQRCNLRSRHVHSTATSQLGSL